MNTTTVGFPNLGLGPWEINKFIFEVGPVRVAWYGLIITLGIIFAVWYTCLRAKKEGFTTDDVLDYALWVGLSGVLGARLYYVAMTWDGRYTSFLDIFAIWNGGLAIYGGIIGGALAIVVLSMIKKKNMLKFFDMVALGVMMAQAIGRWGNFFNGEAYGTIMQYQFLGKTFQTSRWAGQKLPWIMTVDPQNPYSGDLHVHPTFLYESLWNVIGFLIFNHIYRKNKKKFDGQILLLYVTWYGFGRMLIEGFRADSLTLGNARISQLVAFGCVIFGLLFYILLARRAKRAQVKAKDSEAYENLFSEKKNTKKAVKASAEEDEGSTLHLINIDEPKAESAEEETEDGSKAD